MGQDTEAKDIVERSQRLREVLAEIVKLDDSPGPWDCKMLRQWHSAIARARAALAEIERLDRASPPPTVTSEGSE